MIKKQSKEKSIYKFTPSAIEIEYIIKRYPQNCEETPKLMRGKGYYRFSKKGKQSPCYSLAFEFENGYASVLLGCEPFYIDTEFVTVLYEPKIQSSSDLAQLISINPKGVKKYVSPSKILQLRDSTAYELATNPQINEKSVSNTLSIIDKFITKNNLEAFA